MWLLNAKTTRLEYFTPSHSRWPFDESRIDSIKYAILSHTWHEDEPSYQDVLSGKLHARKGYRKVEYACQQALNDGISHVWVDTCCINKESSAELSEAINSMFGYYRDAQVCYVYLGDVPAGQTPISDQDHNAHSRHIFTTSRWFTRGWTLQELIAPLKVRFFGAGWNPIGTKKNLERIISARTGIPRRMLDNPYVASSYSIAQRMSWAAGRDCTREEDRAYSLMGIFDINMPLLYGEGGKAFLRLQEEIIKISTDHSIFAWTTFDRVRDVTKLLAPSPDHFKDDGGRIIEIVDDTKSSFTMTNAGLKIILPVVKWGDLMLAVLNCRFEDDFRGPLALIMQHVGREGALIHEANDVLPVCNTIIDRTKGSRKDQGESSFDTDEAVRVMPVDLKYKSPENLQQLMVYTRPYPALQSPMHLASTFWVRATDGIQVVAAYPSERWNPSTGCLIPHSGNQGSNLWAFVELKIGAYESFVVAFGFILPGSQFKICGLQVQGTEDTSAVERCLFSTQGSRNNTFDIGDGRRVRVFAEEKRIMGHNVWVVDTAFAHSSTEAETVHALHDLSIGR